MGSAITKRPELNNTEIREGVLRLPHSPYTNCIEDTYISDSNRNKHIGHHYVKNAYLNILKILPPKTESFQIKSSDIFHISSQNIDCGYSFEPPRRGGSNEYPQSMFLSRNTESNVYPCKP